MVFPGERDHERSMSNNSILFALYRMGYHSRMTGHGFRGVASTVLHELGHRHELIELQLAHQNRNAVSAAYNHGHVAPTAREDDASLGQLSRHAQEGTEGRLRPTESIVRTESQVRHRAEARRHWGQRPHAVLSEHSAQDVWPGHRRRRAEVVIQSDDCNRA